MSLTILYMFDRIFFFLPISVKDIYAEVTGKVWHLEKTVVGQK